MSAAPLPPPEHAPDLSQDEGYQVRRSTAVGAAVVHEAIRLEGDDELSRSPAALAWSGLAAGLSMGFSLIAEGVLQAHLPAGAEWAPLVSKFGYSFGFLVVVLGRQQLFTENTLTAVLPLMARRDAATLARTARLWAIVLAANLAGALAIGWALAHGAGFEPQVREAFATIARASLRHDAGTVVLRGVYAGWLIALMVWMAPAARQSRILLVVLITWLVGAAELSHVVAGSVEAFHLAALGGISWGDALGRFVLPALSGNVIGGTALVAALNHAQVVAGGGRRGGNEDEVEGARERGDRGGDPDGAAPGAAPRHPRRAADGHAGPPRDREGGDRGGIRPA